MLKFKWVFTWVWPLNFSSIQAAFKGRLFGSMDHVANSVFDWGGVYLTNFGIFVIKEKGAVGEIRASSLAVFQSLNVFQVIKKSKLETTVIFSEILEMTKSDSFFGFLQSSKKWQQTMLLNYRFYLRNIHRQIQHWKQQHIDHLREWRHIRTLYNHLEDQKRILWKACSHWLSYRTWTIRSFQGTGHCRNVGRFGHHRRHRFPVFKKTSLIDV